MTRVLVGAALAFALLEFDIWSCGADKDYDPSPITRIPRPEGELPPDPREPPPPGPPEPKKGAVATTATPAQAVAPEPEPAPPPPPPPPKKETPQPRRSGDWDVRLTQGSESSSGECEARISSSAKGGKAEASVKLLGKEVSDKSTLSKSQADALWKALEAEKWWTFDDEKKGGVKLKMGKFSRNFSGESASERYARIAAAIWKSAGCDDALAKAKKALPKKKSKR